MLIITSVNTCLYCGNLIPIDQTYCPSCGAARQKIRPVYAKNVKLRKCGHCDTLIPRNDRYCLNCGSVVPENEPQTQRSRKIQKIVFIILTIITIILMALPIANAMSEELRYKKWHQEYETSRINTYEQGLSADYIEYDIAELLSNMRDDNFSTNYRAKYDDKYVCITGQIYGIGYNGSDLKLVPMDGEYAENRRLSIDFYNYEDGIEFSKTYSKGNTIKVYGHIDTIYSECCTMTVYRVESAQ